MKRIASPICTCSRCGHKYIDENMYEWAVIDPAYKFWFYFFANNRGIVLMLSLMFGLACTQVDNVETGIRLFIFSAIWVIVCFVYVRLVHKKAMIESQERCNNPEYIQLLNDVKYNKLAMKYDDFYKKSK